MTPSSLHALDVPKLVENWRQRCKHAYGRRHIAQLTLPKAIHEAQARLAWMGETHLLHNQGLALESPELPDILSSLADAKIEGAVLPAQALWQVLLVICESNRLLQELATSDLPRYIALCEDLTPPQPLFDQLSVSLDEEEGLADRASPELKNIRQAIRHSRQEIRGALTALLRQSGLQDCWQEAAAITIRQGRYVLPLKASHKGRIKAVTHDRSATGETLFVEPLSVLDLNNALLQHQQEELAEMHRILRRLTAQLAEHYDPMLLLCQALGLIDAQRAGLRLGQTWAGEVPELKETPSFDLRDLRHPLLCLSKGWQSVVPSTLALGTSQRQLILTGPNTGGKTALLKSLGLTHVVCYLGLPIPAKGACGWFNAIEAVVGDNQDLAMDLSTFSGHIMRVKEVLQAAQPGAFILIDELGSGTDPREGSALATAIAQSLKESRAVSLITTHLEPMKQYAVSSEDILVGSMEFDLDALAPTYRLQLGITGASHAFDIASRMGLPPHILAQARQRLHDSEQEVDRLLRQRDRILSEINAMREETESDRSAAEKLKSTAKTELEKAAEERDRAYRESHEAWQKVLDEAKDEVRKRIKELKSSKDTASIEKAIQEAGTPFQQQRRKTEKTHGDLPAPGETGLYLPLRIPAQVVRVDSAKKKVRLTVRGKEMWAKAGDFKAQKGMKLPQDMLKRKLHVPRHVDSRLDIRGLRRDQAERALRDFLDEAQAHGLHQVSVVHGFGDGILASLVRELIADDRRVHNARLAPPENGGGGVTELVMRE